MRLGIIFSNNKQAIFDLAFCADLQRQLKNMHVESVLRQRQCPKCAADGSIVETKSRAASVTNLPHHQGDQITDSKPKDVRFAVSALTQHSRQTYDNSDTPLACLWSVLHAVPRSCHVMRCGVMQSTTPCSCRPLCRSLHHHTWTHKVYALCGALYCLRCSASCSHVTCR